MQKLYTKKEAAEILKVSPQTIENYIRRGLLTPLYPGGETSGVGAVPVRFAAEQVENFFRPAPSDLADC